MSPRYRSHAMPLTDAAADLTPPAPAHWTAVPRPTVLSPAVLGAQRAALHCAGRPAAGKELVGANPQRGFVRMIATCVRNASRFGPTRAA